MPRSRRNAESVDIEGNAAASEEARRSQQCDGPRPLPTDDSLHAFRKELVDGLKDADDEKLMYALEHTNAPPFLLPYDRRNGNELLYWTIALDVMKAICPMLCQSDDPNPSFQIRAAETPLLKRFTQYGSSTFEQPGGGALQTLTVPAVSVAALHQSYDALHQIVCHGGDINAPIPETGQTPLHVVGLCQNPYLQPEAFCGQGTGMPPWNFWPNDDRLLNDKMLDEWLKRVWNRVSMLHHFKADICARDKMGRDPVVSAIAGGALWEAAAMCEIYGSEDEKEQMDFEPYIMEVIRMTGAEHKGEVPSAQGVSRLLASINLDFLSPPSDKKLAQAKPKIIPLPKAAAQHAKLARHAASTATNPNPLKRKAGAAGEANNTFSSSIARLVVAAIEAKSWRVLKWLVTCMHAQEMCFLTWGKPLAHLAVEWEDGEAIQCLVGECLVDMTAKNSQGESPLIAACVQRKLPFLANFCRLAPLKLLSRELRECHPVSGLTALGHAVANGYASETLTLLQACRRASVPFASLLERNAAEVEGVHQHKPLFLALIRGHSAILRILLKSGMKLHSWACVEHIEVASGRVCPSPTASIPEGAETVTLLMCATALGSCSDMELLLEAGASATAAPPDNTVLPNALSVALDWAWKDSSLPLFVDPEARSSRGASAAPSATAPAGGPQGLDKENGGLSLQNLTLQDSPPKMSSPGSQKSSPPASAPVSDTLAAPRRRKSSRNPPSAAQESSSALDLMHGKKQRRAIGETPEEKEAAEELRLWQNWQKRAYILKLLEKNRCPTALLEVTASYMLLCSCCGEEDQIDEGFVMDKMEERAWEREQEAERRRRAERLVFLSATPSGGGCKPSDPAELLLATLDGSLELGRGRPLGEGPQEPHRLRCIRLLLERGAGLTPKQGMRFGAIIDRSDQKNEEVRLLAKLWLKKLRSCAGCHALGLWLACACKEVWYCGEACQKDQWKIHKKQCKKHTPPKK